MLWDTEVGVEDQTPGWISYALAAATTFIGSLLGIIWFWLRGDINDLKEAQKTFVKSETITRIEDQQDELVKIQGRFVTHDELRLELEGRFNEMDTRRLQMHNHTMEQINQLIRSVEGLRSDMREDIRGVYQRIDSGQRRRATDGRV